MEQPIDLLARPVYGMGQVDRILGLPAGTSRRWIDGYTRGSKFYLPIVRPEPTGDEIVTWGEFAEARHLAEFRDLGIRIRHLRVVVERLRSEFGELYPLAQKRALLDVEGREIVRNVQEVLHLDRDLRLVVVRNDQLVLGLRSQRFVDAVVFDDKGVPARITPEPLFGRVFLDPVRQFGRPTVRSVPTEVILEQYMAGDDPEMIAALYQLELDLVHEAIRFETYQMHQAEAA